MGDIKGKIHSFQSLGTVDGEGIRYVVFAKGCNLRCGCCHNPDTWDMADGQEFTAEQVINKAIRYKDYFGDKGGITVSGGEPLLQAEFASQLFALAKAFGINTCLDTSGSIFSDKVKDLLSSTDRVLLDIKYTTDEQYKKYVGCSLNSVIQFLEYLNDNNIPTTVRQVVIPTLNDNKENIENLNAIIAKYACIDKVELLPFRKICQVKYDNLKLDFPFKAIPEPTADKMKELENLIEIKNKQP